MLVGVSIGLLMGCFGVRPAMENGPSKKAHEGVCDQLQESLGHTPSTAGTFRKKFRKNSGKTPETLSELFLEFPSRVRLDPPSPDNSRHLRLPEHFQNCLPPSTAGGASFFSEVVPERASQSQSWNSQQYWGVLLSLEARVEKHEKVSKKSRKSLKKFSKKPSRAFRPGVSKVRKRSESPRKASKKKISSLGLFDLF